MSENSVSVCDETKNVIGKITSNDLVYLDAKLEF
jgi:hypothetical protein